MYTMRLPCLFLLLACTAAAAVGASASGAPNEEDEDVVTLLDEAALGPEERQALLEAAAQFVNELRQKTQSERGWLPNSGARSRVVAQGGAEQLPQTPPPSQHAHGESPPGHTILCKMCGGYVGHTSDAMALVESTAERAHVHEHVDVGESAAAPADVESGAATKASVASPKNLYMLPSSTVLSIDPDDEAHVHTHVKATPAEMGVHLQGAAPGTAEHMTLLPYTHVYNYADSAGANDAGVSVFAGARAHTITCSRCGMLLGWRVAQEGVHATHTSSQQQRSSSAAAASSHSASASSQRGASPSAHTHTRTHTHTAVTVVPFVPGEEDTVLAPLTGTCLTAPRGWWTYEVCPKRGVRQFHASRDGQLTADWSMGSYDALGRLERSYRLDAPGYYTSQFYTGGQRCDETNKGRQTEVMYFCCPHITEPTPVIESIDEPSTCKYRIRVCVPFLCVPAEPQPERSAEAAAPPAATPAASDASSAAPGVRGAAKRIDSESSEPLVEAVEPVAEVPDSHAGASTPVAPTATPSVPVALPSLSTLARWYLLVQSHVLTEDDPDMQELSRAQPVAGISPVRFG